MHIALINSPSLGVRPVSRSMAGGLGFDGSETLLLPPLDLAIMAATLRNAGDTVAIVDADPLGLDATGVCSWLEGGTWDVLIGTVSLPTLDQDAAFLAELRRRHPHARILGKTMIRDQQILRTLLQASTADLVIHGEADLSIAEIVHGRSRSGTAWLEPSASGSAPVCRFDAGEPVADLNRLPLPARDLLPNSRYRYPLLGTPVATLQTSRGCPFPCGYYCPYPLVEGVKWRSQTPERIFEELKAVVEGLGISKIYFRDATFTLDQQRIARLCELVMAAGWQLEWVCETRVDCVSDPLLEQMRAAGCVGMLIGVETGDEQVMHHRHGKKGLTLPKLAHLRNKTRELGIRLHFLLIVGLPQETRESIVSTYELVQRYEPDTIGVTVITPYPGTPLYQQGMREGWIDSLQWRDYGGHQAVMHTPNLSREDLIAGKRWLEEGFAILQRRRIEGPSPRWDDLASRHYEQMLRWAYRLEEPIAQLHKIAASLASPRPVRNDRVPAGDGQANAASLHPSNPIISVVIPTHNRCAILRKTLLAFASQTIPSDQFEVIVVDDGSSDDTPAMLRRWDVPLPLRVLAQEHRGANAARNLAVRAARGDIVLFTGDDMIPEPAFLESHWQFHRKHASELDAMLGFIDWSPEITVTPFMRFLVSPEGGYQFAFHRAKNGKADFGLFYTSNVSVKRSLLLKQAVLFDPDFTYPAWDDIELGYRLARQGLQLHYNPMAVTRHHHAMTPESYVQRQRNAGRMAVILAEKHPELDKAMLGVHAILQSRHRVQPEEIAHLLGTLRELDKPSREVLAQLRVGEAGLDDYYAKQILYPVYHTLLRAAYQLGVIEGAEARAAHRRGGQGRTNLFEVSIIIPVWNKVELTRQCLEALAKTQERATWEVVIVDNGSTDETAALLASLGGDVQIVRNQENLGFAKACNQGAKVARGRYLVFLNNDTIPQPGWLDALVREVEEHPDVAVVGSKLLYPDGTIQHAGVAIGRMGFGPYHLYRGFPADAPAVNRRRELQAVTAACMLVRREVFEAVGGFEEGYRNGFEDVDLCLAIRARGGKIVYQPQSVLYHLESQTPGRNAHELDNGRLLRERWGRQWWVADEDLLAFEDGLRCDFPLPGRVRWLPLASDTERETWRIVAETQRAAQRRDDETVRRLIREAGRWPADAGVLRWGALVAETLGDPQAAVALWRRVLELQEEPMARMALAKHALASGRLEEAEQQVSHLPMDDTWAGAAWHLRGVIALQRQAYETAATAFARAVEQGADPRTAGLGLVMARLGLGQGDGAWEEAERLFQAYPDDAEVLHWLLRAGTLREAWDELAERLARFVARNPGDVAARYAFAGILLRSGRLADAQREAETIRLLKPDYEGLDELEQALGTRNVETRCAAGSAVGARRSPP